jgi:hypothetical protein
MLKKIFLHGKNDSKMAIGYTFHVGYIYRADCTWESIDKAIVSLQIPEVLNDEVIEVLLCKKFESAKRSYRFKP